jgi:hypothetical protein
LTFLVVFELFECVCVCVLCRVFKIDLKLFLAWDCAVVHVE